MCQLQNLVRDNQWEACWDVPRGVTEHAEHPHHRILDAYLAQHLARSVQVHQIPSCVWGACGDASQQQHVIGFVGRGPDRLPVTVFDQSLSQDATAFPAGSAPWCACGSALIGAPRTARYCCHAGRQRVSAVRVAPAALPSAKEFGVAPGTVSTGKMIPPCASWGFDMCSIPTSLPTFDHRGGAARLLARLKHSTHLPLFTSCAPAG